MGRIGARAHRSLYSGGHPAAVVTSGEPVFGQDPTDTMLINENFDSYSTVGDFIAQQTQSGVHLGDPESGASAQLITGWNGSGKAYRQTFVNNHIGQEIHLITTYRNGHAFQQDAQNPITDLTNGGKTIIVQDHRRITTQNPIGQFDGLDLKYFEMALPISSNLRQLWFIGDHGGSPTVWPWGTLFACIGKDETFWDGRQSYFNPNLINLIQNALWYRSTFIYRPNTSGSQIDGQAGLWVDGVELIRSRQDAVGVIPPNPEVGNTSPFDGTFKPWCLQPDVDLLGYNGSSYEHGVGCINWWHNLVGTTFDGSFTVDLDEVLVWTRG